MGRIAAELADQVIVTTDDPHSEDPQRIIDEITTGKNGEKILDRKQAIEKALRSAQKGDLVVIAGRGHEKYQDFNGKKVELDDCEAARRSLKDRAD
jgi:UDP-N-acetylmuramoyl-L-alanyl-D-glutamate--2,6-diaminopimelate ligase